MRMSMIILNQETITTLAGWATVVITIAIILLITGLIVGVITCDCGSDIPTIICFIVCVISFISLLMIAIANPRESTDRCRYEVTLDESVSITDIYEKYDVVEQRGDIWVLEDKKGE